MKPFNSEVQETERYSETETIMADKQHDSEELPPAEESEKELVSEATTEELVSEVSSEENVVQSEQSDVPEEVAPEISVVEEQKETKKEVAVSDWATFVAKLADASVTKISLKANLTADKKIKAKVGQNKIIEGNNKTIFFDKNTIEITANKLTITNINLESTGTKANEAMFTGAGNIELKGKIVKKTANAAPAINLPKSKVTFNSALVEMVGTGDNASIISNELTTNGGVVTVKGPAFYQTSMDSSKVKSVGTEWHFNTTTTGASTASMWTFAGKSNLHFDSTTKILLNLNINRDGYKLFETKKDSELLFESSMSGTLSFATVFSIAGATSKVTLSGKEANTKIKKANSSLFIGKTKGVQFNIRNGAQLEYNLDYNANIIYTGVGGLVINVSEGSKLNLQKTTGVAVAVLLEKSGNNFSVTGGSDLIVYNSGNGIPSVQTVEANHALMYKGVSAGDFGNFTIKDTDSSVDITADSGSAITTLLTKNTVSAGHGTFFITRGRPVANSGVIRSFSLTFLMDGPKYFDFQHLGDGRALNGLSNESSIDLKNSDISLWQKGKDITKDPSSSWTNIEIKASGSNLERVRSSNSEALAAEVKKQGGLMTYTRFTANNQIPTVEAVRVPTDADKKVFARVLFPESKSDKPRGAYENEVTLTMHEVDPKGKVIQQGEAKSQNADYVPYKEDGNNIKAGVVAIEFPKLLTKGNTIKVIKGYRGPKSDATHDIPKKNVEAEDIVRDITPPLGETVVNNIKRISTGAKSITGKASEPGYVTVYTANKAKKSITVATDKEGNYDVPMIPGLKEGDSVFVTAKDNAKKQFDVLNPPSTNDIQGNEQEIKEFKYHDRDFVKGTKVVLVGGEITLGSAPTILDFGKNEIGLKAVELKPKAGKPLIVTDTRVNGLRKEWTLALKMSKLLQNRRGIVDLTPGLSYTNQKNRKQTLSKYDIVIERTTHAKEGELVLSKNWGVKEGFHLSVPVFRQKVDEYSGEMSWTLQKSVSNKEE